MTGVASFEQYRQHANELDSSLFLGRLAWYSVPEMKVSHNQVVAGLNAAKIGSILPPIPREHDVFKRVTGDAQVRKEPVVGEPNVFENYLLRPIEGRGENFVIRRLVVERVDRKGKKLGYRQLRDIFFDKSNGAITVNTMHPDLEPEINPIADRIVANVQREFLAWRGQLNAYSIREFVRKMLMGWGATPVRDGLYFVPEERASDVNCLDQFVNSLPGGAMFHSMPLLDDVKQRTMIRTAFESDTTGAIDKVMVEIKQLRDSGKEITSDHYAKIKTKYDRLVSKTSDYRGILETTLDSSESQLELFQRQVIELITQVKT